MKNLQKAQDNNNSNYNNNKLTKVVLSNFNLDLIIHHVLVQYNPSDTIYQTWNIVKHR